MTPIVIVTRPAPMAAQFADQLRAQFGDQIAILLSPLIQIENLPVTDDLADLTGVVFTSAHAVGAVQLPAGMRAWCVGPKTAARAQEAGFDVIAGPGDALGLAGMITNAATCGRLAHIRGRHVQADVAGVLHAAGVPCLDIIAYEQHAMPLSQAAKTALNGEIPVVLPLFSARTATILGQQGPFRAALHLVVMSEQIKLAAQCLDAQTVSLAAQPRANAMKTATMTQLDVLLKHNTDG